MREKLPTPDSPGRGVRSRRLPPVRNLGEWRKAARRLLTTHRIQSDEADWIAGHVLGLSRGQLAINKDRELSVPERRRLSRILHQRLGHVPLQYMLGDVDFSGVVLKVRPGVFIPRPETEGLVDHILEFVGRENPVTILDVGTGCGAIALAVASARPCLRVWATDASEPAVRLARHNAGRLGLDGRVTVVAGDLTLPFQKRKPRCPLRVVVSNPPYISFAERKLLSPEILEHEPELALFAKDRGTAVIGRLAPQAARMLSRGGLFALEIGEAQGRRVREMLVQSGDWVRVRIKKDLAGKDRYALALRSAKNASQSLHK